MFYNLLNNANKFTAGGTITLGARQRVDEEGQAWIDIRVTDTGIGMSEQERSEIFEAFHQADTSATREYGGTGLGLTIVRKLCERIGARVTVSSARGEGSTFTVSLRPGVEHVDENSPRGSGPAPVTRRSGAS